MKRYKNLYCFILQTALFLAAKLGKADIVSYLVACGANPNKPNCYPCHEMQEEEPTGDTALHIAVKKGHHDVVKALCCFRETDLDYVNFHGIYTQFHCFKYLCEFDLYFQSGNLAVLV